MSNNWQDIIANPLHCAYNAHWIEHVEYLNQSHFPSANQLTQDAKRHSVQFEYAFVEPGHDEHNAPYYELQIVEQGQIPTRKDNTHDFFNALVWQQWPATKARISYWHAADIKQFGLHPRTYRRHQLTHFDECGVVLLIRQSDLQRVAPLLNALAHHDWNGAFLDSRALWHTVVHPLLFGHATLEMLLRPFIGLTSKWLAVVVPDESLPDSQTNGLMRPGLSERMPRSVIDACMLGMLNQYEGLAQRNVLSPLPLLGVPGWYANQTTEFYANTDYFRPRNANKAVTTQLAQLGI